MQNRIYLLLTFFISITASTSIFSKPSCSFDYKKMSSFLQVLRNYKSSPVLLKAIEGPAQPRSSQYEVSDQMAKWMLENFEVIQKQVFSKNVVPLVAAKDLDNASFEAFSRVVWFGVPFYKGLESFDKKNGGDGKALPIFISAHELGHFIQDLSVLVNNNGKSLNGYIADEEKNELFQKNLESLQESLQTKKINERTYFQKLGSVLKDVQCLHAEVDAYAYLIMHSLKMPFPKVSVKWNEVSDTERGDFTHENAIHKWDHKLRIEMGKFLESIYSSL